ncbi:unnamed protein product [Chironomus riparius]|uniref:Uncharacterized protein n=1 Tax=Chironomus riparius TaxID=315576 RepID=A0A9P0IZF2_9DIPT|nr:unnamed protein product [Chironomus riparius]
MNESKARFFIQFLSVTFCTCSNIFISFKLFVMKSILILLLLGCSYVSCKLDTSDKCPVILQKNENFEIEELFHKWNVLKLILHYEGRTPVNEYRKDVELFYFKIKGLDDKKKTIVKNGKSFKFVSLEYVSSGASFNNTRNYKFNISVENNAVWKGDAITIQVLYVQRNLSILMFCDSDRLYSVILTVLEPPYSQINYKFADETFENLSLNVWLTKDLSFANIINGNHIIAYVCVWIVMKLINDLQTMK